MWATWSRQLPDGGDIFTEDSFDLALGHLYKAAVRDVRWVSAAAMINDLVRTTGHSVSHVEVGPSGKPEIRLSRFFVGSEHRVDLERLYYRDYFWRDEAIPRLDGLGHGELVHKNDLYTDHEKTVSAVYNEFRRVNRTQDGFFLGLHGLDGDATVLSFGNSQEREGWGHDQLKVVKRLAPHLHQFARVRRAMASAKALGASLAELLENRLSGIFQVDLHGRVVEANDRARHILLKRDGLGEVGGALTATNQEENVRLQHLLAQALPPFGAQGSGGSMKITRRKAPTPLVLEVHPVRDAGQGSGVREVRALVLAVDPAARCSVDPDLAASLLGLTPMEGRVAVAVASGQTAAGIAYALGSAESTVKTHLKQVYRKLGVRKQAGLVRRILSLKGLQESPR